MIPLALPSMASPHLPEGGLITAAVHEFRAPAGNFAHAALVVLLLAGHKAAQNAPVFWISTAQNAYPPGIAWLGLDPGRVLFAEAKNDAECLGGLEVALRGGMTGIAEAAFVSRLAARRLGLAARQGGAIGFLLRHAPRQTAQDSTAFATRWFIQPAGEGQIRAEILYAKAGRPGVFFYEIEEGFHDAAPPALVMVSDGAKPRRAAG